MEISREKWVKGRFGRWRQETPYPTPLIARSHRTASPMLCQFAIRHTRCPRRNRGNIQIFHAAQPRESVVVPHIDATSEATYLANRMSLFRTSSALLVGRLFSFREAYGGHCRNCPSQPTYTFGLSCSCTPLFRTALIYFSTFYDSTR